MIKSPLIIPKSFKRPVTACTLDKSFSCWRHPYEELYMDLGCGVGYHSIQLAQAHPQAGIIAIERTRNKFLSLQRRIANHSLENIFSVHRDAREWVPHNIASKSLQKIFFLYPNPYPKNKQANKRWHRQAFFSSLLEALKHGGTMTFATNEEWLHKECEVYLSDHWGLKLLSKQVLELKASDRFRTHFEKKYLLRGESCFNLVFAKV